MPVVIPVADTVEVQTVQQETTNEIKVKSATFDFESSIGTMVISYGDTVDGQFVEKKVESWVLKGAYYMSKVGAAPTEASRAEDLFAAIIGVITELKADQAQRDALIANGELTIG